MNLLDTLCVRIVFESREHYRVMTRDHRIFPAELAGRIRNQSELWPAVGDWVQGTLQAGDWVQITEVLSRKSVIARKDPGRNSPQILAANVDTLFVVTSANQDLNLARLERYVAIALAGNVKPVIVINKIDLAENPEVILQEVEERFLSHPVLAVSVHKSLNLEALTSYANPGETVAFVGSSGVGKSSLANFLLGGEKIFTQEIRESDGRGRHTTTHRELHIAPNGVIIIDTPGIRQVGLTDDVEMESVFGNVEALARKCRFSNCQHRTEPNCAIRSALDRGELDPGHWANYQKLQKELAYEQRKASKELQSKEKKKWAQIGRDRRKLGRER